MSYDGVNIDIKITWAGSKPVAFQFGEKIVWEKEPNKLSDVASGDILDTSGNMINMIAANKQSKDVNIEHTYDTLLNIPVLAAIKFSVIFLNGLSAGYLVDLLAKTNAKLTEINNMKDLLLGSTDFVDKECNGGCRECNEYNCIECDCSECESNGQTTFDDDICSSTENDEVLNEDDSDLDDWNSED